MTALKPGSVVVCSLNYDSESDQELPETVLVLWTDPTPTQRRAWGTVGVLRASGAVDALPRSWLP